MAYFMTTELGREVPLEDWIGFHRDRVLSTLFQMRQLGVPRPALELSMIEGITGLPRAAAQQLADLMLRQSFLEREGTTYVLADQGVRWVLESPRR